MKKTQRGALKITGTHGDFTFVKTADGYVWKEKSEVTAAQRESNPNYAAQRDNSIEFARAAGAAKLIRRAFKGEIDTCKDRRLSSRLVKLMMQVVKSDPLNPRGKRIAANGDLSVLQGFQCNAQAEFAASLKTDYSTTFERVSGKISFKVPSFVPETKLEKPESSTHFRLVCAGSEIDLPMGTTRTLGAESALIPIDMQPTALITLNLTLTPASVLPVIVAVGIQFVEVVNGFEHPTVGGQSNALYFAIVDPV